MLSMQEHHFKHFQTFSHAQQAICLLVASSTLSFPDHLARLASFLAPEDGASESALGLFLEPGGRRLRLLQVVCVGATWLKVSQSSDMMEEGTLGGGIISMTGQWVADRNESARPASVEPDTA